MPIYEGKKVETLTVKVDAELRDDFNEIAQKLDRSMSYVVRELAMRGLAQYTKDKRLRLSEEEEMIISGKETQTIAISSEPAGDGKKKKGGKVDGF